jgi:hypothetical protein
MTSRLHAINSGDKNRTFKTPRAPCAQKILFPSNSLQTQLAFKPLTHH